jgi:hypothetical protein
VGGSFVVISLVIGTGMPRINRSTVLTSIALMVAVVAIACGEAAAKPTAEPPTLTAVPTVAPTATPVQADYSAAGTANTRQAGITDVVVQECLAEELGLDVSEGFDRSLLRSIDGELMPAAFEACGAEQGGRPGGGGGDFLGRLADGPFGDPAVQECLSEELGEDFTGGFGDGAFGGGGGGFGIPEELTAALDECGVDLAGLLGSFGGGAFGGGGGRGGFGGGGGVRGDFGGGAGSFQECMNEQLGDGALELLRNPTGAPSPEVQAALEECGAGIAVPVEPDGGIGDGADPLPIEPTATSIPVSEFTIEQLTCISSELDPADLASAVIATSSGDLSEISDDILAALQTCGVGT